MKTKKWCPKCGLHKHVVEFFKHKGRPDGLGAYCKICQVDKSRESRIRHPETSRRSASNWRKLNPEKARESQRISHKKRRVALRNKILESYGGKCVCCEETTKEFLTIEHINRDGAQHKKKVGAGFAIYLDLERQGFPKDVITLLCMNCNFATRTGIACPHTYQIKSPKSECNVKVYTA